VLVASDKNMFKIGNLHLKNNVVLAPMEGVNCRAFRQVCFEYGAGLVSTPMILVNKLFEDKERALNVVNFYKKEHPLMVQLGGSDSEMIKNAVLLLDEHADVFDINLGCPESDVLALKAGCFFSKHPEQLKKVIPPMINNTNKPVTAKIRVGWDENSKNTVQVAKILEDFGVSAITVHGRTRNQSYSVKADWSEIRKAKEAVNIPVIGNGDVLMPGHAKAMIEQTKCDAVMIARGAKGNPLLLKQVAYLLEHGKNMPEPTELDRINSFLRFSDYYNDQPRRSLTEYKAHAMWFSSGFSNAHLMREKILKAKEFSEVSDVFKKSLSFDRPKRRTDDFRENLRKKQFNKGFRDRGFQRTTGRRRY
jgi:tRNA-dihydrouridine synthase B